ncbi:MAG: UDP-2,3-diacylglucosamine diphosphatase LpxI [Rickettsiales bacterium]|jgi:DUF1009 family protein|nr:UDP-2,3-diacylglucosamine diphosphatase LpxI [Rickettsiales bacterium]
MYKKIGIVAGSGSLPLEVLEFCDERKIETCCVLLRSFAKKEDFVGRNFEEFYIGHVGKMVKHFKKNNVERLLFAGGVKKPSLFSLKCDITGFFLLKRVLTNKILGDNTILEIIIEFLEKNGFVVENIHNYINNGKFIHGFNGKVSFENKEYLNDIELGKNVLNGLSDLDIGQSIIIQQGNVIGIECVEGTQRLIERSKELIYKEGRGAFLLKIKKLNQTDKADLPSIGVDTITQLKNSGLVGIVVDYKNCVVICRDEVVKEADRNGIFIYGIDL